MTQRLAGVMVASLMLAGCASEQRSWEKAKTDDSVEAYEQFKTAYPESTQVPAASARIEELDWTAAAKADSPEALQRFLDRHAQSAQAGRARQRIEVLRKTAIQRAAATGDLATIHTLLDAGGNINSIDGAGVAPLHVAARECRMDAVALLLQRGAVADYRAQDDSTPLHWAARSGCVAAVNRLLEVGVDVNVEARESASFIRVVDDAGRAEFVDSSTPTVRGTPLDWAAHAGRADVVTLLIQKGATVNRTTGFGLSPLHHAAVSGSADVAGILLKNGARAQLPGLRNGLPIHYARTAAVAKLLAPSAAALRTPSEFRGRPLHNAAFLGYTEAMTYLLDNGVPVDERGSWNMDSGWSSDATPLWTAAYGGQLDAVKLLESRAGDLRFATKKGELGGSLLHAAAWGGHKDVVSYLITRALPVDARADMPTNFPLSQPWKDVTPLGIAAHFGNVEAIEALLSAGADINAVSPGDWTPIGLAIYGETIDAVKLLLARGATLNLTLEQIDRRNTSQEIKALLRERLRAKP